MLTKCTINLVNTVLVLIKPVEKPYSIMSHLCNLQIVVQSVNSTISHYVKRCFDASFPHRSEGKFFILRTILGNIWKRHTKT